MSEGSRPPGRSASDRVAGATAVAVATGALACGVCCVLPFALPAAALAVSGGALAWFGRLYGIATLGAALAGALAWGWVGWRSLRTRRPPASATLLTMVAATVVLAGALLWPHLEGTVLGLLHP